MEAGGGGAAAPAAASAVAVTITGGGSGGGSGGGVEDWEERDTPLRQLEAADGEEREGARVPRAIDNQYSFF